MSRTAAQVLVNQLELNGIDAAFCVPGESYLAILDALHDSPIRLITARHEASAANMAEAYGKLTGRPGICLVTRGPGSTQASVGVHTALQDSTPMILLVGQVPRPMLGREAFQELNYPSVFGGLAKWTAQAESADRVTELLARAFATALSGRPGPVVLALPEDVLAEETDARGAGPACVPESAPSTGTLAELARLLASARKPLLVVGEGGWTARTGKLVLRFAEQHHLPVATSFRCQDYVDNRSRFYAGPLTIGMDPKLAQRVRDADLIVAIGGRLGEISTQGYTLLEPPRPRQILVHVHPDPNELGTVYAPELAIAATLERFAEALSEFPVAQVRRDEWTTGARADYDANLRHEPCTGDAVDLAEVMAHLRERLPDNAILTCGAGNFTVWAHRFYEFSQHGTQLAPRSGAMGYGVPAALAAKVVHPDRTVVCLAGDGDFLMSASELATAVQHELPVVVLIANNGMYGTIRMHQERHYPGRVVGTDLVNPDFAALAHSFGAFGEVVGRTEHFPEAFERAIAAARPALLELRLDRDTISPRARLSAMRESSTPSGR